MSRTQNALTSHQDAVLRYVLQTILPTDHEAELLITPHVWRDRTYVGTVDGRVASWVGRKANLARTDFRFRTLYIDLVRNVLPIDVRIRLFGATFTQATMQLSSFIVIFTTDFPAHTIPQIEEAGFITRLLPSGVVHACYIVPVDEFMAADPRIWAAVGVRLLFLQRAISRRRRALKEYEMKLQGILFRTGYLHGYLVRHGLHLHSLSPPRRSGEFGHDLHAIVANPRFGPTQFAVGIELYLGAIGYHIATIPAYVQQFHLSGMLVLAKDDPFPALVHHCAELLLPFARTRVTDLGRSDQVGIHHIPLAEVLSSFIDLREELDTLVEADL